MTKKVVKQPRRQVLTDVMMETLLEKELTQIITEYLYCDYEVNGNKITNLNI